MSDIENKSFNTIIKFYCEDCDTYVINIESHLLTKSHLIKQLELGKIKEIIYLYNCDKCDYHSNNNTAFKSHKSTMKHKLSDDEYRKYLSEIGKNNIKIGTEIELFIYNLLVNTNEFSHIDHTGPSGNLFDIIYVLKCKPDCLMGIQIKKLSKDKSDRLMINNGNYPDNTLIILINLEEQVYSLFYQYEINYSSKFTLSKKYDNRVYIDIKKFTEILTYYMYESTVIHKGFDFLNKEINFLSSTRKIEYNMKNRLEKWLKDKNIIIRYNEHVNCIDGFITSINDKKTNIKVQLKASNTKHCNLYKFHMHKGRDQKPYSTDDNIDYFIYEISNESYDNRFYFISMDYLIKNGYITDDENKGKTSIFIAPFDHKSVTKNTNKHGTVGISYDNSRNKWIASIGVDKKLIGQKRFDNKDDAIKHRLQLEEKYLQKHWTLKFLNNYKSLLKD